MRGDGFALFPDGRDNSYLVEKLLSGLLDAYEYADMAEALDSARRLANDTIHVTPTNFPRDGQHSADMIKHGVVEWYTLPEPLYRLYRMTGDEDIRSFAQEMEHWEYWNGILNGSPLAPRHAYSHVNCLNAAAQAYWTTGDPQYLEIAKAGHDRVVRDQLFVTGGYGLCEVLFGPEGYLGDLVLSPFDPNAIIYWMYIISVTGRVCTIATKYPAAHGQYSSCAAT